jgi:putative peptidoglycan lipid II flippase
VTRKADVDPPAASPDEPLPRVPDSARSARVVAAGILLSRIAGLVRERLFAQYLGTSAFASAFRAALRMPNVLQNLLGEGTLSASFIPSYSHLLERGEHEAAGRLAGAIFALLLAVAGGLTLAGALLAPLFVEIFFPAFTEEMQRVTAACMRVIFPMTGVLVLSAWALGILNSHRSFFLPYFAPVLWNAAMIATLLALGGRRDGAGLVLALAWAALAGGALQFAIQLPRVLRLEPRLRVHWDTKSAHVRQVVRNAGPAILGRGVVQVSSWIDLFLAGLLFTGAVAVLGYAQTLYLLPVSLFGMSIAAAELPEMSRQREEGAAVLRARLDAGLRRVALLVVPSAIGFIVLGDLVVGALYRTGEFGASDNALVHLTLAGYTVGLLASTATRLYASSLYALDDTRTPARIALIRVILSGVSGAGAMLFLERWGVRGEPFAIAPVAGNDAALPLGVSGLALAAGVAAWVEWLLLRRAVTARIGTGAAPVVPVRLLGAATVAALLARGIDVLLPPLHPIPRAAIVLVPFGALYFAFAHLFGVPDAGAFLSRVRRRLFR